MKYFQFFRLWTGDSAAAPSLTIAGWEGWVRTNLFCWNDDIGDGDRGIGVYFINENRNMKKKSPGTNGAGEYAWARHGPNAASSEGSKVAKSAPTDAEVLAVLIGAGIENARRLFPGDKTFPRAFQALERSARKVGANESHRLAARLIWGEMIEAAVFAGIIEAATEEGLPAISDEPEVKKRGPGRPHDLEPDQQYRTILDQIEAEMKRNADAASSLEPRPRHRLKKTPFKKAREVVFAKAIIPDQRGKTLLNPDRDSGKPARNDYDKVRRYWGERCKKQIVEALVGLEEKQRRTAEFALQDETAMALIDELESVGNWKGLFAIANVFAQAANGEIGDFTDYERTIFQKQLDEAIWAIARLDFGTLTA
jgi:hypothetical protein